MLSAVVLLALVLQPSTEDLIQSAPAQPLATMTQAPGFGAAAGLGSVPKATERRVGRAYGKLPLSFIPNEGQTDKHVRYYAQEAGHAFYFTSHEAVLSFTKGKRGKALHLAPLGSNPNARLEAGDRAQGRVNYLTGSERHTNLHTYQTLTYRELWPGVDMVFKGEAGKLKYEFRLRPGADPNRIGLAYRGADSLSIGAAGNLLIQTPLGTLRDSRPRSYQRIGGRRVAVDSRFSLGRMGAYGFELGRYDRTRSLVIDPALAYSTYLGGSDEDVGNAIAVDAAGSTYITGRTRSVDFPTTAGASGNTFNGGFEDAFVTKLDATGSVLVYSTYLGGSGTDRGQGIAVDGAGSAYVTGRTESADFPTTGGALDTSFNGGDAFVTKLDATGSAPVYSTYLGGSDFDEGFGIAVDGAGSAYVGGVTVSADFPTTAGAPDTTPGFLEAFVTKLDATGSALAYSTYLGGSDVDVGLGIAVDGAGSAYVTGVTSSANFPTIAGASDTTLGGSQDAFVAKLDATGSALAYSTYLGGSADDVGHGIAVDGAGSAYAAGLTLSGDFPTTAGAHDTSLDGSQDAFVAKLDTTGSALVYSTYLGGSSDDQGLGTAVDGAGSAYAAGATLSEDFPTSAGAPDTTLNLGDAFVTKLDTTGSALAYSTYLGGSQSEEGRGIAVDTRGSAYVTGSTVSEDFPTSAGAPDTTLNLGDAFVTKLPTVLNNPPNCSGVTARPSLLRPPNHRFRLVTPSGATDPDGDTVTLTITGVTQDEPLKDLGDSNTSPDARAGSESNNVLLRAERSGKGEGRVYRIAFTGSDGKGGICSGTVLVGVPHDQGKGSTPVDSAPPSFNSFGP